MTEVVHVRTQNRDRELLSQLMQMSLGYWRSQILFTASEIGVFDLLGDGALSAEEIAERSGTSPQHTRRLLNACAAVGLLEKTDRKYENARLAEKFLVAGRSPQYIGHWVRFMARCYRPWAELSKTVRTGHPAASEATGLRGDSEYTRALVLAMHDYALGPGREMVERLDLGGRARLLDVGGGAGSYSIMLAQKYPHLNAVVYDLPPVVEVARGLIAEAGVSDRVSLQAGDYLKDELGSGYDVVLLSNVLHQEDPETCRAVLGKAYTALVDGGLLIIQAAFLNPGEVGPVWAVLQSLQLMLLYDGGRNYTTEEMLELVRDSGFLRPKLDRMSLLNVESFITATKGA